MRRFYKMVSCNHQNYLRICLIICRARFLIKLNLIRLIKVYMILLRRASKELSSLSCIQMATTKMIENLTLSKKLLKYKRNYFNLNNQWLEYESFVLSNLTSLKLLAKSKEPNMKIY